MCILFNAYVIYFMCMENACIYRFSNIFILFYYSVIFLKMLKDKTQSGACLKTPAPKMAKTTSKKMAVQRKVIDYCVH